MRDQREYLRKWRLANRDRLLVSDRARQIERRKNIRRIINERKDVPCKDCGKRYPLYVMDMHHIDPSTKHPNFSKFKINTQTFGFGVSMDTFLAELDKCEVLCANCHRIRTWTNPSKESDNVSV